jgi:hypothetical protein
LLMVPSIRPQYTGCKRMYGIRADGRYARLFQNRSARSIIAILPPLRWMSPSQSHINSNRP